VQLADGRDLFELESLAQLSSRFPSGDRVRRANPLRVRSGRAVASLGMITITPVLHLRSELRRLRGRVRYSSCKTRSAQKLITRTPSF
jgi:hypothetical protein